MEVFLILPKTAKGKAEFGKQLAKFHAEHAQKMIENLPCPTEQKLELVDAIVQDAKQSKL